MTASVTLVRFKLKRNTAAYWTELNPVLLAGEPAIEQDTLLQKIGDGTTAWNDLVYLPFDALGVEELEYASSVVVTLTRKKVFAVPVAGPCEIDIAGSAAFDGKTFVVELTRVSAGAVSWGSGVVFGDDITSVPVSDVVGKVDCVGLLYRHGVGARVMGYIRF